jgi:peptidoglycan/xylan/chitin deacetylase (PgdA/CDA1 family)
LISKLRVLGYHRVVDAADPSDPDPAVVSATPRDFERQVRHLARWYNAVSMDAVLAAQRGEGTLPHNAVLITFDDACRDFAEIAWPILQRYELPATVFVPTAFAAGPRPGFWWDRLYRAFRRTERRTVTVRGLGSFSLLGAAERDVALRAAQRRIKSIPHDEAASLAEQLCLELDPAGDAAPAPVLDWTELRALAAAGVTLAAHTRWHPALTQLDTSAVRSEIAGSLRDLACEAGSTLPVFC